MKMFLSVLSVLASATAAPAAWFTNSVSVDSFVRSAAPSSNYGGAGALAVSGATAANGSGVTNGVFDTFLRFNTAAMVANFDALFGTSNWVINHARLRVTEIAAPNNVLFNRGVGAFEIRWMANDTWTEGTGTPNAPTTTGITYSDAPTFLNVATDVSLGTFSTAGVDGMTSFPLALPVVFANDLAAGREVGLFLTAIDSGIGFTIDSRSFGTASARPYLEVSAVPRPGIAAIDLSDANVVLTATNGVTTATYYTLSSTNLALPLDQWTPAATNQLTADGNFSITLTNAAGVASPRFCILLTR
jgi:hypothetical protein